MLKTESSQTKNTELSQQTKSSWISTFQSIKWIQIFGVSRKRRREFFSALFCLNLWFHTQFYCLVLEYYLIFHAGIYCRVFILSYILWILVDSTGEYGSKGQGNKWFRSLPVWKYWADYFPMRIIKTVNLPPDRNYIFAFHPHGAMCLSFFTHFGTNGTNFHETFPGIRVNLCTLSLNFWHPFYRELVKAWGVVKAKYGTIKFLLSQTPGQLLNNKGQGFTSSSIALAVGGSQESIYTEKGSYILHIKKRKGFIKIALETGASIVPVFSFGETDMYNIVTGQNGSLWRRFQEFFKKLFKIAPIVFSGRGLFQYNFGLLPFRVPINTVFGAPIHVEKKVDPTQEEIDKLHGKYVDEVGKLFEEHKWKYVKDPHRVRLVML